MYEISLDDDIRHAKLNKNGKIIYCNSFAFLVLEIFDITYTSNNHNFGSTYHRLIIFVALNAEFILLLK